MRPNILKKALKLLAGTDASFDWLRVPSDRPLRKMTERSLLQLESAIGAQLFSPLPEGHRRDFFCLDATTWIWSEEWLDDSQQLKSSTVRYEVQDKGILKVQDDSNYRYVEGQELSNLFTAIKMYYERVTREIYHCDPKTGQPLE